MSPTTGASNERLVLPGSHIYAPSRTEANGAILLLARGAHGKRLVIAAEPSSGILERFDGARSGSLDSLVIKRCPTSIANAAALRELVPSLTPRPLGLATSAGFGDRLGIATPGHIRALNRVRDMPAAKPIAPIFAQQSIREMTRTRRSPEDVMSDATWGAFEAGWRSGVGADADHLKSTADIDACLAAGFSFYTVDPGDHVDDSAHDADEAGVEQRLAQLPWGELELDRAGLEQRYVGRHVDLGDRSITLERGDVARAAAKYGRALAHVKRMYRHLAERAAEFDFEVSVDETGTPTSPAEHAFIALELQRLEVRWVSLAPRFPGSFEKGIDYIGDLEMLRADLAWHAAIARALGPYKLSLHSGSDKFSVYPLIMEATGGLVHLKTAGTSYLEALRVLAEATPALFREILSFSSARFPSDRASYHISADLAAVPHSDVLSDGELVGLLSQNDARQVLHVTFGSVLDAYGDALRSELAEHEEQHYRTLARHFVEHLRPFAGVRPDVKA